MQVKQLLKYIFNINTMEKCFEMSYKFETLLKPGNF